MKKRIEHSISYGLFITATDTEIGFALKAAIVKPPKSKLGVIDIMRLAGGVSRSYIFKRLCSLK